MFARLCDLFFWLWFRLDGVDTPRTLVEGRDW